MGRILKSKLVWAAALLLLLFGLYYVVGTYAAPGIVRSQAQKFVRENYGRELTLGEIRIDPLRLQVEMRDLSLPDTDGKPMLAFRRLFVDFEASSLWQRAFVFKDIALEAPLARAVIRADGTVNLADLALPDDGSPEEPLPAVWVQSFELSAGTVQFADLARSKPLERQLTPVNFQLKDFRTTPEGGAFGLSAKTQNAELFEWRGKFALEPEVMSAGDLAVTKLHVPGVLELAGVSLPFVIPQGEMNLSGSYSVTLGEAMQLDLHLPQMLISGLTLRAPGLAEDYVTIPTVVISDTRVAMPANTVTLGTVAVEGLRSEIWTLPDGTLNIDRLFAEAAAAPPAGPAPVAEPAPAAPATPPAGSTAAPVTGQPWTVQVGTVQLRDAFVAYEDRALQPVARFEVAPLNVTASGATLDLTQPVPVQFDAKINGAAALAGTGKVVPETLAADFDIKLDGFPLQALQPYANGTTDLTITGGTVNATGKFTMAPPQSGQPEMGFNGDVAALGFKSIDNALEQDFLNFDRVELSKLNFTLAPDALSIDRVRVVKPFARVIVGSNGILNVSAVFDPAGTAAAVAQAQAEEAAKTAAPKRKKTRAERKAEKQAAEAAAEARKLAANQPPAELRETGMPIRIREVVVSGGGSMDFADFSVQPNFAATIEALGGSITGLSTDPNSRAEVRLDGNVGKFSPVLISGSVQPFAYDRFTDITMKFENISLPVFNPYSGKFAGYNIAKGKLFTDLHYQIDNRQLNAAHKIRIDQLEWGEATASKEEATLPVKFATSLLKDADGVINLDIPVTGTLDDPTLRIGPIVWQVIKNLLAKAVTAPFKALGALFKGAEDAQFVDFAPGSAALDPAAAERLAALGKSLAPKADLRLEVPIGSDAALDGEALAQARFQRELEAATRSVLLGKKRDDTTATVPAFDTLPPERREAVLVALYTQLSGAAPVLPEAAEDTADELSRKERKAREQQARLSWLDSESRKRATAPPAELDQLAQQRAEAVQSAVLNQTGMTPERVFLVRNGKVAANEQQVRFELAIK